MRVPIRSLPRSAIDLDRDISVSDRGTIFKMDYQK
jgi:hypothetical protein